MFKTSYYIIAATLACVSAVTGALQTSRNGSGPEEKLPIDKSLNASGAREISVDVPIGSLHLVTGGSELRVHGVRSCKLPMTDGGRRWMKDSIFRTERKGDRLEIEDIPFGSHKSRDNGNFSGNLEVTITIPEGLNVNLKVGAGTVDGAGRYGSFDGHIGAGTLRLKSLACDGDLNLGSGAGTVEAEMSTPPSRGGKLSAGAGDVRIELPAGTNADVKADVGIGEIKGAPNNRKRGEMKLGDHRTVRLGSGGVKFELHAGTGTVQVGTKGGATWSTTSAESDSDIEIPSVDIEVPLGLSLKEDDDQGKYIDEKKLRREVEEAVRIAQKEARKDIEEARKEVRKAMAEVQKEMGNGKFEKDFDFKFNDADFEKSIRGIVEEALKAARIATDEALKSTDFALREVHKTSPKAKKAKKKG